jgi:adenylate cyclase
VRVVRSLLRRGAGIDWEAEGLLEGAGDDAARAERRELLEELAIAGVPLDALREAVAQDRLAMLPIEHVLAADATLTMGQLARTVGLEEDVLGALLSALGQPLPEPDTPAFGEADVQAARTLAELVDAGVDPETLRRTARVLAHSAAVSASAVRELFGDDLLRPGDSERELGLRYAAVAEAIGPGVQALAGHLLYVHLREQVRGDVVGGSERQAGRLAGTVPMTVAFADLVGFTALGERDSPERLGEVAAHLADAAADAVRPPVRLVKVVGDGVLLAGPRPAPVLEAVERLVAAAAAADLPELRVGVARGQAVQSRGDLYGSAVNRAARICEKARPGQVLADDGVREEGDGAGTWATVGRRRIKGVRESVRLHELRLDAA